MFDYSDAGSIPAISTSDIQQYV